MKKLPKSKNTRGYTKKEIKSLCNRLAISMPLFWQAFGVGNTVGLSNDGKITYYYRCDIERALYVLRHKLGKNHLWD